MISSFQGSDTAPLVGFLSTRKLVSRDSTPAWSNTRKIMALLLECSSLGDSHNAVVYSQVNVFDLKVDPDCGDEGLRERIVRVAQQEARLPHAYAAKVN